MKQTAGVLLPLLVLFGSGCDDQQANSGAVGEAAQAVTTCVTFQRGTNGTVTDAVIATNALTTNDGAGATLGTSNKKEVLLYADLGSIPSYAVVNSATLKLYVNATGNGNGNGIVNGNGNANGLGNGNGNNAASLPINLHRATAAWNEATVTYTSFNQQYDAIIAASLLPSGTSTLKSVDVKSLVEAWVNGSKANNGILLETADSKQTIFVSSDSNAVAYRPALEVCYAVPDEHCAPNPCQNAGVCINGWTGYTCQCAPGFTGDDCEININDCADAPCLNGATCTDGVQSYTCQCAAGFTGTNCEINVNECAPAPCLNGGVCTDGINAYSCACAPGFAGDSCETNINDCAPEPCQNGGTCTDAVNGYSCACATGYSGDSCETNIDDCLGNECQNDASCIDGIASYTCACLPGFAGPYCQININECEPENPCLHGGTCADAVNGYTCACAAGYEGTNCQIDIDDCQPNPCQNDGTCVDAVNSHICQCLPGYSGIDCEIAPVCPCVGQPNFDFILANPFMCSTTPNMVGGVFGMDLYGFPEDIAFAGDVFDDGNLACTTFFDLYALELPPTPITAPELQACITAMDQAGTAAGLSCPEMDDCASHPCLNGGTCDDNTHAYYCHCPEGYQGVNCEIVSPCVAGPCQNGGLCEPNDDWSDYTCTCSVFSSGAQCETVCPPGFGGADCATALTYCALIRSLDSTAQDGEYTFDVAGNQVQVYCHDMAFNPREYLSLARTGDDVNFSTYAPNQTTWYTKVRFHPDTLAVDTGDAAFATNEGSDVQGFATISWAKAADCITYGSSAGTANIDLTGTPFALAPDQITTQGSSEAGSVTYGPLLKTANLTGGGYCGVTSTANYGETPLQLVYQVDCPCSGGPLWESLMTSGTPGLSVYRGPAGSLALTTDISATYVVSALNGVVDPDFQYAELFSASTCAVYDPDVLTMLEGHTGLSDAQADACVGTFNDACASSPCLHGTCTSNSLGGHSCQCLEGVTGPNCDIVPAVCPSGLTDGGYDRQTGVAQLNTFPTMRLTATFQNITDDTFVFNGGTTPQVSIHFGAVYLDLPVTYVQKPTVDVPPGGQFSYDILIDTASLPDAAHQIFFRPYESNLYGTLPPQYASLVSSAIDCSVCAADACPSGSTCAPAAGGHVCSSLILPANAGGDGGSCSVPVGTGIHAVERTSAVQQVWVTGDANFSSGPYVDDMALVTVTSPTGQVAKLNAVFWQATCSDPSAPTVALGGSGPVDITSLFGSETGTFTVQLDVLNDGNTYSWNDAYLAVSAP